MNNSKNEKSDREENWPKSLIEKGQRQGYLTYDEINKVLPDDEAESPEKLDSLLQRLEKHGIEIVDAREEGEERRRESAPQEEEEVSISLEPTIMQRINDPVRMYLLQMGEIPLLTREEELRLAKMIETTRKRFRRAVLESGIAVTEALSILGELRCGDRTFDKTMATSTFEDMGKPEISSRLRRMLRLLRRFSHGAAKISKPSAAKKSLSTRRRYFGAD